MDDKQDVYAQALATRLAAGPECQAKEWAQALARQCQDAMADLSFIAPWTSSRASLPGAPPRLDEVSGFDDIPTLRELAAAASQLSPNADGWGELQRLVGDGRRRRGIG